MENRISAKEARKKLEGAISQKTKDQLTNVYTRIHKAIENEESCIYANYLTDKAKKILTEEDGYIIDTIPGERNQGTELKIRF